MHALFSVRALTANQHSDNAENFLAGGVGADISEANARQARACEVQSCDVCVRIRNVIHRHPEAVR